MNLSLQDCIALSDLTKAEVEAVAEHEHIPDIVAVELGNYLVHDPRGAPELKRMIVDDIEAARRRGDLDHCLRLRLVLHHFIATHPESVARSAAVDPRRRRSE